MYAGTTLRTQSGNIMGAHQRIDRIAKKNLRQVLPKGAYFPTAQQILRFEGKNGPDGIKRKSPARDEPWHFIDPTNPTDTQLLDLIDDHFTNLERALRRRDEVRSAFEAAWLAHAIVDGLTPAHHFPLETKLEELRGGQGIETRNTIKNKIVLPGESKRHIVKNNWEVWGSKGVMTTHGYFEWGFATTLAGLRLSAARPSKNDLIRVKQEGFRPLFIESMHRIYELKVYDAFQRQGWSRSLARVTRQELAPIIVKTVTLAWYGASLRAEKQRKGERA